MNILGYFAIPSQKSTLFPAADISTVAASCTLTVTQFIKPLKPMNQFLLAVTFSSFDPSSLCYFTVSKSFKVWTKSWLNLYTHRASLCPQGTNLVPFSGHIPCLTYKIP